MQGWTTVVVHVQNKWHRWNTTLNKWLNVAMSLKFIENFLTCNYSRTKIILVFRHIAGYLAWADNDATSRSNWSGTQADACIRLWTAPYFWVCPSPRQGVTLLDHFRFPFGPLSALLSRFQPACDSWHWGRLAVFLGGNVIYSPRLFGGALSQKSSRWIPFALDDKVCIGQRMVSWPRGYWWSCRCRSSFRWGLKVGLWL